MSKMETVKLNNGVEMPLEGFGVFQISDAAQCEQVVYDAIKTGYRLLDTAAAYMNEEAVGKGVSRAIADGIVNREELFITTKVWVQDQKNEETAYNAVKTSLEKLNMPYVDLVLLHQPMGDYFAAYRGIEKAYKDGLVRAIGVANFYPAVLSNLCENVEMIPAVNQVVLRWNVQRGVSIIPKSVHVERMEQNIDIWDFALTDEEMAKIASKDLGHSEIVNHDDPAFVKMLCGMKIHE